MGILNYLLECQDEAEEVVPDQHQDQLLPNHKQEQTTHQLDHHHKQQHLDQLLKAHPLQTTHQQHNNLKLQLQQLLEELDSLELCLLLQQVVQLDTLLDEVL